tara:strand:- start:21169 stop:21546 length:378 start_codon:yes stop_codon:yes gene_type:complete
MKNNEETDLKKTHIHEESGIQYYEVKLNATLEGSKDIILKLFESTSSKRLPFETHDEYQVRRKYMNTIDKAKKESSLVWKSSWGPMNPTNALRVQTEIKDGKTPTPWLALDKNVKTQYLKTIKSK